MNHTSAPAQAQLVRLAERDRAAVSFTLDGRPATALEGDTVLTAVLTIPRACAAMNSAASRGPAFA